MSSLAQDTCKCLFVVKMYLEDKDVASIWMKMKWNIKPLAISLARTKEVEINYWLCIIDPSSTQNFVNKKLAQRVG